MDMIIYLAGPFRSDPMGNTEKAKAIATVLISQGHDVFSPHMVTGCLYGKVDESRIADMYESMIIAFAQSRDVEMWLMEGWEDSKGTLAEMETADVHNIGIYELGEGNFRGSKVEWCDATGCWDLVDEATSTPAPLPPPPRIPIKSSMPGRSPSF